MKKRIAPIALAVAFVVAVAAVPLPAAGQSAAAGSGDMKARVSSTLERFPADTAAARDALCAEILGLGPAAVAEICSRVQPPGGADDSKARFAVNGLAVYVTRTGAEAERLLLVKKLIAAAAGSPDKDVAAFFISQVQLTGKAEAVKPLGSYLPDEALVGPAAAALQAIGGPEAAKVLLKALDRAPLPAKVSLVDALGAMRSREAVKKLLALAGSADPGLRRAARAALANIGDPLAGPALAEVRVDAPFAERAEAPSLYLLYARRLAASGRPAEALASARALLKSYEKPQDSQVASSALELIVSVLGEKALPDLLSAVDGPSGALRAAALEMAATLGSGDATSGWIEKAASSGPEVRAEVVRMLGRRGDKTALPFVRELLRDPDEAVRLAAIPAAVRLGRETVLPDLFGLIGAAGEREAATLRTEWLGFEAESVVPEAARRIAATPHPGQAVTAHGEKIGVCPHHHRYVAVEA